jgi:NADH:ubiquinone oxidoreductase subunit 2 (subunit N)
MKKSSNNLFIFISLMILSINSYAFNLFSDAGTAKYAALGRSHHVMCYSGIAKIYDGYSTGKVMSEEHSDGYYFVDKATGNLIEVSANCIFITELKD